MASQSWLCGPFKLLSASGRCLKGTDGTWRRCCLSSWSTVCMVSQFWQYPGTVPPESQPYPHTSRGSHCLFITAPTGMDVFVSARSRTVKHNYKDARNPWSSGRSWPPHNICGMRAFLPTSSQQFPPLVHTKLRILNLAQVPTLISLLLEPVRPSLD